MLKGLLFDPHSAHTTSPTPLESEPTALAGYIVMGVIACLPAAIILCCVSRCLYYYNPNWIPDLFESINRCFGFNRGVEPQNGAEPLVQPAPF